MKYEVNLAGTFYMGSVTVEADSEKEAYDIAIDEADYGSADFDFRFYDSDIQEVDWED